MKDIPEVLSDSLEEDKKREVAIEAFRDAIAERWVAVRNIASHSHSNQYEGVVQSTKAILAGLVSCHGADIHFAPFANIANPFPAPPSGDCDEADPADGQGDGTETTSSGSRGASSSSASVLLHEYRYLSTKTGAWTCLVAPWCLNLCFC